MIIALVMSYGDTCLLVSSNKLETVCLLSLSSTLLINPGPRAVCNLNNSSSNTAARVRGDTRGRCLTLSQTLAQLYSHKWRLGSVQWQPGPPPVQCTTAETHTSLVVDGNEVNSSYDFPAVQPQPNITLPMMILLHCTSNPVVEMWVGDTLPKCPPVLPPCAATPCH